MLTAFIADPEVNTDKGTPAGTHCPILFEQPIEFTNTLQQVPPAILLKFLGLWEGLLVGVCGVFFFIIIITKAKLQKSVCCSTAPLAKLYVKSP